MSLRGWLICCWSSTVDAWSVLLKKTYSMATKYSCVYFLMVVQWRKHNNQSPPGRKNQSVLLCLIKVSLCETREEPGQIIKQSHRKSVRETNGQWDRQADSQAVSGAANSSRLNIWFQSRATNKKCCVFIRLWAPAATQTPNPLQLWPQALRLSHI